MESVWPVLGSKDYGNLDSWNVIASSFLTVACDASCLTGSDGLGYCTGFTAWDCCNVYQPNAMSVNICAVSCDMGYEADSPDFICGELHCWTTVFLKSVCVYVCACV